SSDSRRSKLGGIIFIGCSITCTTMLTGAPFTYANATVWPRDSPAKVMTSLPSSAWATSSSSTTTLVTPGAAIERVDCQYTSTLETTAGSTENAEGEHTNINANSRQAAPVVILALSPNSISPTYWRSSPEC